MPTKSEYARLCATKKSREALAKQVIELAERCGAKVVERRDRPEQREIGLNLGFGPYRVMMTFSGTSNVGAFLGHWYTDIDSDATYPEGFEGRIGGSVNQHHRHKATMCAAGFELFLACLESGFKFLARHETEADRQQRIGPDEWLRQQFEFELCAECGHDEEDHHVGYDMFGLFHIFCDKAPVNEGDDTPPSKPKFYECGICGAWHPATWDGDCRQDNARFFPEQLDERCDCDGWESVDMLGVPSDPTPTRFLPNRPLGLD